MTDQFDLDFSSPHAEYFRARAYAFFQAGNRRKKEHTLNFKIEIFFIMTTRGQLRHIHFFRFRFCEHSKVLLSRESKK